MTWIFRELVNEVPRLKAKKEEKEQKSAVCSYSHLRVLNDGMG
jgi:hypothetical protein